MLQLGPEPTEGISLTSLGLDYSCLHMTAVSAATTAEEEHAELGVAAGLTSPFPSWAACTSCLVVC